MKNFSCHGCSGCCHGSISLTYSEVVYQFSGEFPLIVAYVVSDVRNVPVEKEKNAYAKGMKKFTRDVIGFYDKTETNRKIVVHPQILSLIPSDVPCHHLDDDGLCTIYRRKPSVCSLYPYRVDTPIAWIEEGLSRERNNAFEGSAHIPCQGWSDDAPLIYGAKGPVDDSIIPMLIKRNKEAEDTRNRLKQFFFNLKLDSSVVQKIEDYSKLNDESGRLLQFNFSKFIYWQFENGLIHEYVAKTLISGQIKQLNKMLKNIGSRDDDIAKTYKDMYIGYINESEKFLSSLN